MTMAVSVEGRMPFLDHKLVELCYKFLRNLSMHKDRLSNFQKGLCSPHDIIYRRKIGFAAPIR
jgi:asparagine synthetase B (glutamine-hydrolysing)